MVKRKAKAEGKGAKEPRLKAIAATLQRKQDELDRFCRLVIEARGETTTARDALRFAEKQREALKAQLAEPKDFPVQQFGMIPWPIAERVFAERLKKYPTSTTLREYGMRGGFAISEMDEFLPTWRNEIGELVRLRKRTAELEHYAVSFPATVEAFMKAARELDEERARRAWAEGRISHGPMVNYGGKLALPNWFAESEAIREYWRAETKPKGGAEQPAPKLIETKTCQNCGRTQQTLTDEGRCFLCMHTFGDLAMKAKGQGEKSIDIAATWAKAKEIVLAMKGV